MRPFPLLLHLLLCLAILANGIASAQAGVRMLGAHAAPVAVQTAAAAASSCHETADAVAPDAPTAHEHGDCCRDGGCDCTCPVPLFEALLVPALAGPAVATEATAPAVSARHPAPRLPHLIRPPIG